MLIQKIQEALCRHHLDGWLFFDHHRRDPLAYRILQIPDFVAASRRWYYFIPAKGEPRKLAHRIESGVLDSLPGEKLSYSSWEDQAAKVNRVCRGFSRIAMQYSPNCAIPYVSLVDGGTLELIRAAGVEILSSADLVQEFEARWTEEQFRQHVAAGKLVDGVRREAFCFAGERLRTNSVVTEFEVQQFIRENFQRVGLMTDHGPIVAVNANASDPHYEPSRERTLAIKQGDLVLIDLWAKLAEPNATYYDVTWTGFCGDVMPSNIQKVFEVVRGARLRASDFVLTRIEAGMETAGYQVDDEARGFIRENGFGEYFFHRTGHSIGTEVHGTGANMDNLESHDERRLISGTCFSVEPGVYLPEFGIRSEVNVYVANGFASVTGEQQKELIRI
jgi:Xaa-Pro aminopeptidase